VLLLRGLLTFVVKILIEEVLPRRNEGHEEENIEFYEITI